MAKPFIENPFSDMPFIVKPFNDMPFIVKPFIENPFSVNPLMVNPFNENPLDDSIAAASLAPASSLCSAQPTRPTMAPSESPAVIPNLKILLDEAFIVFFPFSVAQPTA